MSPALRRAIEAAVAAPGPCVGFRVPRLTSYLGRFIRHCGWYPSPVLRLFRRDCGRFTEAHTPGGDTYPVCLELEDTGNDVGLEIQPGSAPGNILVDPVAEVRVVDRFE